MAGRRVESGQLVCSHCLGSYLVRAFIPRFVSAANYATSFGLQWNRFRRTQLDSHSGVPISEERFYRTTGLTPAVLSGMRVLDVGCGAGRFSEVALAAGAHVIAVDYSSAVDACFANLGYNSTLDVIQGDIYGLPFADGSFDLVYCLGVLQHTPRVREAFQALPRLVRPGGTLVVDVYPELRLNLLWPKYWLRPLTRRMSPEVLFRIIETAVPVLLPFSDLLGSVPLIGRRLRYAVPVANYRGVLPLTDEQLREWSVLDTFDMLAPAHDHPQKAETVRRWFADAGMEAVHVERRGFIIARGIRPMAGTSLAQAM
jgi:SAM-dependent methyltransferase